MKQIIRFKNHTKNISLNIYCCTVKVSKLNQFLFFTKIIHTKTGYLITGAINTTTFTYLLTYFLNTAQSFFRMYPFFKTDRKFCTFY